MSLVQGDIIPLLNPAFKALFTLVECDEYDTRLEKDSTDWKWIKKKNIFASAK